MRLKHIGHSHYRISDADAGRLAKGVGGKLPGYGRELSVIMPDGKQAWLSRTPYAYEKDSPKRGWVWAIYSDRIYDRARLVKDDPWHAVYEMNPRPKFQVHVYEEETEWIDPEDPDGYEQHTDEKVDDDNATLEEVIGYAEEFGIQPRSRNDLTQWWESYEDREYDFSRNVSRIYTLHVARNGKPLDESTFNRINRLIKEASGSREKVRNPKQLKSFLSR